MEAILTALVALVVVIGLMVVGIRISVYLFSEHAVRTRHFTHALPVAHERLRAHTIDTVRRARHHHSMNTGHSSARYALHSFMAIAFILLLTLVAAVSILLGRVH
jgi:hypothetical protein